MPYDFYAKKKKTPDQVKEAQKRRDSFKAKTAKPKTRGPKRSIAY